MLVSFPSRSISLSNLTVIYSPVNGGISLLIASVKAQQQQQQQEKEKEKEEWQHAYCLASYSHSYIWLEIRYVCNGLGRRYECYIGSFYPLFFFFLLLLLLLLFLTSHENSDVSHQVILHFFYTKS